MSGGHGRSMGDPFDMLTDRFFGLAHRYTRFGLSLPEHDRLLRLARLIGRYYELSPEHVLDEAIAAAGEEGETGESA